MHFDNLLFILLIAMAVLFRLLASKAGEAKKKAQKPDQGSTDMPHPSEPIAPVSRDTDAERIRSFLEALGQPAGSQPPPPVVARTEIPPRPLAPVQPPRGPFSLPRSPRTPDERHKRQVIPQKASPPLSPVFEIQERPVQGEPPGDVKSPTEVYGVGARPKTEVARAEKGIAAFLRPPGGLRNAIILREIFGPPRSLQPFDLIGRA